MKLIPLSQGAFAKVDDADYEWLTIWNWYLIRNKKRGYQGYASTTLHNKVTGKHVSIKMHRLILGLSDPKVLTDHEDGDSLNNQRFNLRTATSSQNAYNRKVSRISGKTSKYRGVCFTEETVSKKRKDGSIYIWKGSSWKAAICAKGKITRLGTHKTEEAAAKAYNKAAKKIHGKFARLNIIT